MITPRREFLKISSTAALSLVFPFSGDLESSWRVFMPEVLARKSPESQGVSSAAISKFINAANASGLQWHSFMFLRHGHVIAEGWWKPFDASYKHTLYSLSKSFTSTAIGMLVKDGKITVEDQVISFFNDDLPTEVSDNLKQMKIKHLLTMNTGHEEDTIPKMRTAKESWTKTFLSLPVDHTPGSHFLYNTGATYMLGAIIKKVSGQDLELFLTPRLFEPLGIKGFDWEKSPQGLSTAGWGLRVKTEDIARFGQMYLQKGKWNKQDILTENWVADATSYQTSSNKGDGDWSQGYGYQFWRCKPGFFRGDGAFGQFCIVMPQHDAVVVVNSESWDMQKQMTIIWENLLPGIQQAPLPEDNPAFVQLKKDSSNLVIPVAKGSVSSPLAKKYSDKVIKIDSNDFGVTDVRLKLSDSDCQFMVNSGNGKQTFKAGWEKWLTSSESQGYVFAVPNRNPTPSRTAATATWVNDNTLQINLRFVEAIHGDKITITFQDNDISLTLLNSVAENTPNNPDTRKPLQGKLA